MDPLKKLGRAMRELGAAVGCDMDGFMVMPDLDGDNNLAQVVFVLPSTLADVDIDAEAARLVAEIEEYERREGGNAAA